MFTVVNTITEPIGKKQTMSEFAANFKKFAASRGKYVLSKHYAEKLEAYKTDIEATITLYLEEDHLRFSIVAEDTDMDEIKKIINEKIVPSENE